MTANHSGLPLGFTSSPNRQGSQATTEDDLSFSNVMAAIGYFEHSPTLAVAVSGGPDSMALLMLANAWTSKRGGNVIALTVDHGLREESAYEAAQVAGWCKNLGVTHHTLTWAGSKPASGLQEAARNARYKLLTDWCRKHHILHLLTAHHRDDQAETLMFRLARGSGMDGLASLPLCRLENGVRLIRPLLGFSKNALLDFLENEKQGWLEDPSNQKMIYARNRLRKALSQDNANKAADLAGKFGTIRNLLEYNVAGQLTNAVSIYPEGYATITCAKLKAIPYELGIRVLASVICTVSGSLAPPRSKKLEDLYTGLTASLSPKKRTLHGCVFHFRPKSGLYLVTRELNAMESAIIPDHTGTTLWDNRFVVTHPSLHAVKNLEIRALMPAGLQKLRAAGLEKRLEMYEKPVLYALPSFWALEELLAVPHIGYYHSGAAPLACHARFKPAKALAGSLFYGMTKIEQITGA